MEPKKEPEIVDTKLKADLAVMLKEQGNTFFRNGDYESANRCYSKALEHDQHNPHIYLNLSVVNMKLRVVSYEDARKYATVAIFLTFGKNAKAWFRRGISNYNLKDLVNAYYDLQ